MPAQEAMSCRLTRLASDLTAFVSDVSKAVAMTAEARVSERLS